MGGALTHLRTQKGGKVRHCQLLVGAKTAAIARRHSDSEGAEGTWHHSLPTKRGSHYNLSNHNNSGMGFALGCNDRHLSRGYVVVSNAVYRKPCLALIGSSFSLQATRALGFEWWTTTGG